MQFVSRAPGLHGGCQLSELRSRRSTIRKPTLADVARLAGVAPVTVSRVLNTPDLVNQATLVRVRNAISNLDYQVNIAARALAGSRWGSVGVLVPSLDHVMFPRQLRVFEGIMSARDTSLLISATNYDDGQEEQIVRKLVARGVDGILLTHLERPDAMFDYLAQNRVPAVLMGSRSQAPAANWIAYDDYGAMQSLVRHLYELGHRRIGMIGDSRAVINGEGRVKAVLDQLAALGLAMPSEWLKRCDVADVAMAFDELMGLAQRPTAILCGNDRLAAAVIGEAKLRGLSIPQDISVTGFDDIELAAHPLISLTTVQPPWRQLGEEAAEAMLAAFGGKTGRQVLLEAKIIERQSTAAPNSP